jgi:uncharacterized repeat protein (TIGR01451 family)
MLLVIQMQGATINASNTDAYGDGAGGDSPPNPPVALTPTDPQQANLGASGFTGTPTAGTYEFVVATGPASGGSVPIQGKGAGGGLLNSYVSAPASPAQGQQTFQVIRVPQYTTAILGNVTAAPWNGSTGGVLVLDVAENLNLAGTADVSGLGFRGGGGRQLGGALGLVNSDFVTAAAVTANGSKGEGIAGTPQFVFDPATSTVTNTGIDGYPGGSDARGAPANAGGGSTDGNPTVNDQNSGGGGGANGGRGGIGGRGWFPGGPPFVPPVPPGVPSGGFGGSPFPASISRIILGGGGGAGTNNDGSTATPGIPAGGTASSGGAGGGIVIVRTNTTTGAGTINANGAAGLSPTQDGAGGGGAGGSVIVQALSNSLAGLTINANGGTGGNAIFDDPHGPGGGGGGGVVFGSPGASVSRQPGAGGRTGPGLSESLDSQAGAGITGPISIGTIPGGNSGAECRQGPVPQSQNLRLVKRITAITRGGNSVSFNAFVDDPNDPNDTLPGWSQLSPVGVPSISQSEPLQSGDQVEYTVYFLADGNSPVLNTNICDLIPEQTAYVPDTSRIKRAAADPVVGGTYFTPLAPLPSNNSCTDQTNPNGAVVYELGDIPSTTGDNYGFVRFRVRIN